MTDDTCVWTIVVAAGSSRRFGGDKLAVVVADPGSTVRDLSVDSALAVSQGVVVVVGVGQARPSEPPDPRVSFVEGGETRADSVRAGLAEVPAEASIVVVHDAARPLADAELFGRVIDAVTAGAKAAVPVVSLVDTIRTVDGRPVDRDTLRAVQTPQGFEASVLRVAHAGGGQATDDAALVEALGYAVVLVEGDVRNLKVTRPVDIEVARALQRDL